MFQNRRNKWKRQLAAELEAANMAHAAAQRIRAVPILYHATPHHHHHDSNGNPTVNSNSTAPTTNHVDNAAVSLQAALSSYYYHHPGHHTSNAPFMQQSAVGNSVSSVSSATSMRATAISGLV